MAESNETSASAEWVTVQSNKIKSHSSLPLFAFTDCNNSFALRVPCYIGDSTTNRLDFALQNLFLANSIPNANITSGIYINSGVKKGNQLVRPKSLPRLCQDLADNAVIHTSRCNVISTWTVGGYGCLGSVASIGSSQRRVLSERGWVSRGK
jgi:hypothetical protein